MSLGFGFSLPAYLGSGGAFAGATLNLDFTSGNQTLDPRITFTRSTTATFTGSNGLIQTAAIDAPRFDYNPTTLAPLGLLIEEQRTNVLIRSIPDAGVPTGWTVGVGTGTFSHTLVPATASFSGFQNFIRHEQITSGRSYLSTAVTLVASTTYTLTVRFNPGTVSVTSGSSTVIFVAGLTGATGTLSLAAASVPSNGVATLTFTTGAIVAASVRIGIGSANDATGVAEFGAWQLEAGAFATSYIPTVASQVTRAADVAVMTGTNFSSWYNATEGTLYGQADWMGLSTNDYFFAINNGTSSNLIAIGVSNTPLTRFIVIDGGVTQASVSGPTPVANVAFKIAGAYQANSFAAATNGVLGTVDTSGSVPTGMSAVSFTSSFGGFNLFNGHIRQIAYYPRRLANAELQGITA